MKDHGAYLKFVIMVLHVKHIRIIRNMYFVENNHRKKN